MSGFYLVEAFAVHAYYVGLGNKGVRVDGLDCSEYADRFASFGQYADDLFGLFGVPPHTLQYGYASVDVFVDVVGYFFVFFGEYKYLNRLSYAVDNHIAHIGHDDHGGQTEYYFFNAVKQQVGGGYNQYVAIEQHSSYGNFSVFVYDGGDDVGSSCTAVVRENNTHSYAAQHSPYHTGHKGLIVYNRFFDDGLQYGEHRCCNGYSEYGSDAELKTDNLYGEYQQSDIDGYITYGYGYFISEKDEGGYTGYSSGRYLVGQEKTRPSQSVQKKTERNENIIFYFEYDFS